MGWFSFKSAKEFGSKCIKIGTGIVGASGIAYLPALGSQSLKRLLDKISGRTLPNWAGYPGGVLSGTSLVGFCAVNFYKGFGYLRDIILPDILSLEARRTSVAILALYVTSFVGTANGELSLQTWGDDEEWKQVLNWIALFQPIPSTVEFLHNAIDGAVGFMLQRIQSGLENIKAESRLFFLESLQRDLQQKPAFQQLINPTILHTPSTQWDSENGELAHHVSHLLKAVNNNEHTTAATIIDQLMQRNNRAPLTRIEYSASYDNTTIFLSLSALYAGFATFLDVGGNGGVYFFNASKSLHKFFGIMMSLGQGLVFGNTTVYVMNSLRHHANGEGIPTRLGAGVIVGSSMGIINGFIAYDSSSNPALAVLNAGVAFIFTTGMMGYSVAFNLVDLLMALKGSPAKQGTPTASSRLLDFPDHAVATPATQRVQDRPALDITSLSMSITNFLRDARTADCHIAGDDFGRDNSKTNTSTIYQQHYSRPRPGSGSGHSML